MHVMALSTKQHRFVDEYMVDQNATQAYKRAGYKARSEKSAKAGGGRLYGNPAVRAAIDARRKVLAEEVGLTAREMWRESGYIALSDITHDCRVISTRRGVPLATCELSNKRQP